MGPQVLAGPGTQFERENQTEYWIQAQSESQLEYGIRAECEIPIESETPVECGSGPGRVERQVAPS